MTTPQLHPLDWAPDEPIRGRLVVVGCSRRKTATGVPVSALELYQGGCIPALRARIGHQPDLRARVRILSGEHGLVDADTPLLPYDRPLTPERAGELRPRVGARLLAEFAADGVPRAMLVIAGPLYLRLLTDVFTATPRPRVHWFTDPTAGWDAGAAVLDEWGWP